MNIDLSLQSFMDPYITIGRATFAKTTGDEELNNTILLTFAGMGLAKAVVGKNDVTWVPTDRLEEVRKTPSEPIDLAPFMGTFVDGTAEPEMTPSLRLIIADMIEVGRRAQPESAENITVVTTLLGLVGQGLASFVEARGDKMIWVAAPELIDRFESIKAGLAGHAEARQSEIQMDDHLRMLANQLFAMAKLRFRRMSNKRVRRAAIIQMLLTQEIAGAAIAYKDGEGRLAWKASADLRRSFE
jgi:hypothetical protein